jgi:hypothetical protein
MGVSGHGLNSCGCQDKLLLESTGNSTEPLCSANVEEFRMYIIDCELVKNDSSPLSYLSLNIVTCLTKTRVWIGDSVYWIFTSCNYK